MIEWLKIIKSGTNGQSPTLFLSGKREKYLFYFFLSSLPFRSIFHSSIGWASLI